MGIRSIKPTSSVTSKKRTRATDFYLYQIWNVQIGPEGSAQSAIDGISMHQLHFQLGPGIGRLKGGDGFLVGHGVIAGKGPQTQRCLRGFNG